MRLRVKILILWLAVTVAVVAPRPALGQTVSSPFQGTALWISQIPAQISAAGLAESVGVDDVRDLYVNAGDGSTPNPQFTPSLVQQLKAGGASVCAWLFDYGVRPRAEAEVAASAAQDGAQCLIIDAEGQYDGRYGAAQVFVRTLRKRVGSRYPIGLAGQAEVAQHPAFPYSVFLGPGGFDFDLPQIYWHDFGTSVDQAFKASIPGNEIYGRPIVPVGQLYGSPSTQAIARFRADAAAYGFEGLSFFSLDAAQPTELMALGGPVQRLHAAATLPTLRPGADGDQVVWAQELLNAAGARLPVGGFYGAQTSDAVAAFQAGHRLHRTGVLNAATWKPLMRFKAQEPSWGRRPPQSARG